MALVASEQWLAECILYLLGRFNAGDMRIALFKNDVDPEDDLEFADFTVADFDGYDGPRTLENWTATPGGWIPPRWQITHPAVFWTPEGTSSNTIYGYFVYETGANIYWFGQRNAENGILVGDSGDTRSYTVVPKFTDRSEFP